MITYSPGQPGQASLARHARRPRYVSRGQALIMAVLVMFLLVGLGGLFIAMINNAMVQTTRADERDKLEDIVLAGLRLAQNELINSGEGADWRPGAGPDKENPGWVYHAGGFFKIVVNYGSQEDITSDTPFLKSPLDRFVKIDVEARYALENPPDSALKVDDEELYKVYSKGYLSSKRFITRKVTALMPIGLTDNLLWITNLDGSTKPVTLGSTLELTNLDTVDRSAFTIATDNALNLPANQSKFSCAYVPIYNGPIRSDADVEIGNMALYLLNEAGADQSAYQSAFHVARDDKFIVNGELSLLNGIQNPVSKVLANHSDSLSNAPALTTASANVQTITTNPLLRKIDAPRLDQRNRTTGLDRYRALTRDSYGEGIYIDNSDDIQYGGNLEKLRAEWLNLDPENSPQPHWQNGAYFPQCPTIGDENNDMVPGAVEVIMHDWGTPDSNGAITQLPYVEFRRYDGEAFVNQAGQELSDQRGVDPLKGSYYYINMEYPRNGVIFAEGNLVVKAAVPSGEHEASGGLPASLAYTEANGKYYAMNYGTPVKQIKAPGGAVLDSTNVDDIKVKEIRSYVSKSNRRFDLTIVSSGTIYIEGNLLGPASRSLLEPASRPVDYVPEIVSGSAYDSKLALLAMDNVCLNPTRLYEMAGGESEMMGLEQVWRVTHDRPLQLMFNIAGSAANTRFLLRDAGEAQLATSNNYAAMRMSINNTPFNWLTSQAPGVTPDYDKFYFSTDAFRAANLSYITAEQWSSSLFPLTTTRILPRVVKTQGVQGYGAQNVVRFELANDGVLNYLISAGNDTLGPGFTVTGGDIQVDALIYAQRGSWFIIPGPYYNNDENSNPAWPLPKYHEPLDIRIVVNGAIVENRPAPLLAQEEWLKRWRGSNLSYYTETASTTDPAVPKLWDPQGAAWDAQAWRWTNRRMGIEYHYDATLARPVCFTKEDDGNGSLRYNYLPRLPKLPVSPTVFSFGALRGA